MANLPPIKQSLYGRFLWGSMEMIGVRNSVERKFLAAVSIQFVSGLSLVLLPFVFLGPQRVLAIFPTSQLFATMIIIGIASLAFMNTIWVIREDLLDPVKEMRDFAERISRGQLDLQLSESMQNDEVGELQDAFQTMHAHLKTVADRADALGQEQFDAATMDEDIPGTFGDSLRKMQQRLRDRITSLRKFQAAVEHAGHGIYITDTKGTIEYVNSAFERITGYEAEESIGENPRLLNSGEMPNGYFEDLWETITTGDVWEEEVINQRKNGEIYYAEQTIAPFTGPEGDIDGFVAIQQEITERKEREQELERTQTRFRALTENAHLGVLIVDDTETVRYANEGIENILGYDPADLIGESLQQLIPEQYSEKHESGFSRYLQTGTKELDWNWVEFPGLAADGAEVPLGISFGEAMVDEEHRFTAVIRDITERKREHRKSQQYRQAVESSNDLLAAIDTDQEFLFANEKYCQFHDLDPNAIEGEPLPDVLGQENFSEVADAVHASLQGEESTLEITREGPEGRKRTLDAHLFPIQNDEGEILGGGASMRDITPRIEHERHLETLISNLPGIVYRCRNERGWPMEMVRGRSQQLTGYRADEIVTGDISWGEDIIHPEDREDVWSQVQQRVEANDPFELTYRITTKSGEEKWVWEKGRMVTPVDAAESKLEGFISDITDQKRLEDDLQETVRHLQVIDRVLRHNLHNDMNIIEGYADMIRDASSGQVATYASNILEQSEDLLNTVGKEREITQLLSESQTTQPVNIAPLVTTAIEDLDGRFPSAQISVDVPDKVMVSAIQDIYRAIQELIGNAIVHSDQEHPRVRVSVLENEEKITIHVVDNGPGIPEMERKILAGEEEIEPLYHGSGLGLWLVYLIVKKSEGEIEFMDNEPQGSIVTIELKKARNVDTEGSSTATEEI